MTQAGGEPWAFPRPNSPLQLFRLVIGVWKGQERCFFQKCRQLRGHLEQMNNKVTSPKGKGDKLEVRGGGQRLASKRIIDKQQAFIVQHRDLWPLSSSKL